MELGDLGIQIVIKSKKVFDEIKYISYEIAESKEYYIKRIRRDKLAKNTYLNEYRSNIDINGLFIMDIIRKEFKHGDKIL